MKLRPNYTKESPGDSRSDNFAGPSRDRWPLGSPRQVQLDVHLYCAMEKLEARHRKELKALEGEKRAALKKAKSTKGKQAKEALAR